MDFQKDKKMWVLALSLVAAGTLFSGVYYTWLIIPPGLPKTAAEAMKTIGSARFEHMPDSRKQEYMEEAQKLFRDMPDDQRRKLWHDGDANPEFRKAMETMHENAMDKRMTEFAKATPEERNKMLDQIIDMQEKGGWGRGPGSRAGRPGGQGNPPGPNAAQGGNPRRGGPGRHDPGRMRNRIKRMAQNGNPQRAALMGEFFQAIQQRRKERGLPAGGFGRH